MSDAAISIAASSLMAQNIGLETASENLANVDTPGYARETPVLSAPGQGGVGEGVLVTNISRVTDPLLGAADQAAHSTLSGTTARQDIYSNIENLFPEPSSTGLASQLSTFYDDWNSVANYPTNSASRQSVLTQAQTIVNTLNASASSLQAQATQAQNQLTATVAQDNGLLKQIAGLNQQILTAGGAGGSTAPLQDQRDKLLGQLASDLPVTVRPQNDGTISVTVGGISVIQGNSSTSLQLLAPNSTGNTSASWAVADAQGNVLPISSPPPAAGMVGVPSGAGTLGGLLDGVNTILPKYQSLLDNVASALAGTVNAQQKAGVDQNGVTGADLFTAVGGGAVTAANISLATTDPTKLAAAAGPQKSPPTPSADGTNAQLMAALANSPASADVAYQTAVGQIGTDSQLSQSQLTAQKAAAQAADAAVQAVSGVNQDEEMTNVVSYQQAYQAAAKVINVVNSTIQSLLSAT